MLRVFVPRSGPGETRVAATPETVKKLVGLGASVAVEAGAGETAHFRDAAYEKAGAAVVTTPETAWGEAGAVLVVGPLAPEEARRLRSGALVVGLLDPYRETETVRALADGGVSSLAMELVPRISRAQSMDALSSQASIGGYKAVLLAASRLDRYFPLLMTAAGTVPPAKVVVMGAGVAGLQAVATAKRLGAVVEVSDIRPAVEEQVASLGGKFIELPMQESGEGTGGYAKEMGEDFLRRQREIVARHVAQADVVITTALVPGKKAPVLVTREMVESMRPGAVIVDMAVAQGGNCELSEAGREVTHQGVLVLGPRNLPAEMPKDASMLYARNVLALLTPMIEEGELVFDLEDEVVAGALVTHEGRVRHEGVAEKLGAPRPAATPAEAPAAATGEVRPAEPSGSEKPETVEKEEKV